MTSRTDGDRVVVDLRARRMAAERRRPLPLELRMASLVQLVADAGGQLELEEQDSDVALVLKLAHAVPAS